jgi:hypothetical protein
VEKIQNCGDTLLRSDVHGLLRSLAPRNEARLAKKVWDSVLAKTSDAAALWRGAPHFTLTISHAFRG